MNEELRRIVLGEVAPSLIYAGGRRFNVVLVSLVLAAMLVTGGMLALIAFGGDL